MRKSSSLILLVSFVFLFSFAGMFSWETRLYASTMDFSEVTVIGPESYGSSDILDLQDLRAFPEDGTGAKYPQYTDLNQENVFSGTHGTGTFDRKAVFFLILSLTGSGLCLVGLLFTLGRYHRLRDARMLKQSFKTLAAQADQMGDGIWISNLKGDILHVNPIFCELMGKPAGNFPDLNLVDMDSRFGDRAHLDLFVEGLMDSSPEAYETFYHLKNSSAVMVSVSVGIIDSGGESYLMGTLSDNRAVVHLEALLSETRRKLEEFQSIAHIGYWKLNAGTGRLDWSDEIYRIFELKKSDFNKSYEAFLSLVHPDDKELVNRSFMESVENRSEYDLIHRLLFSDGRVKHVHERCRHEFDGDGNITFSIGSIHDITYVKEMEIAKEKVESKLRQAQKLEALGTLAGGIAHDFNNILGAVIGYAQISMDTEGNQAGVQENLKHIFDAGCRAKELIRQILTFSRQTDQKRNPCMVGGLVNETLKLIRASLPSTITIKHNILSESMILADETQIHQVIMNICTNAFHAMKKNGGVLSLELIDVDIDHSFADRFVQMVPGKYQLLRISDTGHGMKQELVERIFEPFFTTKSKMEGTGLGLSTVHGIVMEHGGKISVYSEVDLGTTFNIYFPIIRKEEVESLAIPETSPVGSERILVVDDEELLAEMLKKMLGTLGYLVETKNRPLEALTLIREDPHGFDLVITDLTMPEMTGDRLTEEILNVRRDIPVIVTTGFSNGMGEKLIHEKGARALVLKPVVKKVLAETIRKVLDDR